jgi:hypothetical protein
MKNVYQLIAAVSQEIAETGISKDRNNSQQGYKFRSIDDVYNKLSPILARAGLVILPRVISRELVERTTVKGSILFYTTVQVEFDFISSHDGSKHTISVFGEAMDSGDKSTNKAMSAAYKYAAFQSFCIPTEGDNDADQTSQEPIDSRISEEQAASIEQLAAKVNVEIDNILKWAKVASVRDIPVVKFATVMSSLQRRDRSEV